MATRKHLEKSYTKSVNNSTFDASSIDSTTVGEKLFRPTEEEEENGDDGPVVFICAKCKLPVGDSLSWDGSEDGLNQIRLKRVTDNVMIGKENRLYEASKKSLCLVVDLICRGCHSVLGMVYTSTPKNLDHKRFTFCFSVADIDRCVVLTVTSAYFWETLCAVTGKQTLISDITSSICLVFCKHYTIFSEIIAVLICLGFSVDIQISCL
uniref:Protein Mis18-alpha n=1 Tax=Neolamprologus brichardi TaxID=32507 RepID=A0A3Q4H0Z5_NEOBR